MLFSPDGLCVKKSDSLKAGLIDMSVALYTLTHMQNRGKMWHVARHFGIQSFFFSRQQLKVVFIKGEG